MPKACETETTLEWLEPSLKRSGTQAGSLFYFGFRTIGLKERHSEQGMAQSSIGFQPVPSDHCA